MWLFTFEVATAQKGKLEKTLPHGREATKKDMECCIAFQHNDA